MTKKPTLDDDAKPRIYAKIASKDTYEVDAYDSLQTQITELAEWKRGQEQRESKRNQRVETYKWLLGIFAVFVGVLLFSIGRSVGVWLDLGAELREVRDRLVVIETIHSDQHFPSAHTHTQEDQPDSLPEIFRERSIGSGRLHCPTDTAFVPPMPTCPSKALSEDPGLPADRRFPAPRTGADLISRRAVRNGRC